MTEQKFNANASITLVNGIETNYVAVDDRGLNYGDGVFETIAVNNNQPVFWGKHWARLQESCEALKLNIPDELVLLKDVRYVLNGHKSGVIKIIITRGRGPRGYGYEQDHKVTCIVQFFVTNEDKEHKALTLNESGISMMYSRYSLSTSPLSGIKHLNRIEQILATSETYNSKYNEVICCDEKGCIVECGSANIFTVKKKCLQTPILNNCGIKGVIRDWVINYAHTNEIGVEEKQIDREDITSADEVFITNSIIGLRPVVCVEDAKFTIGKLTRRLQAAYIEAIAK